MAGCPVLGCSTGLGHLIAPPCHGRGPNVQAGPHCAPHPLGRGLVRVLMLRWLAAEAVPEGREMRKGAKWARLPRVNTCSCQSSNGPHRAKGLRVPLLIFSTQRGTRPRAPTRYSRGRIPRLSASKPPHRLAFLSAGLSTPVPISSVTSHAPRARHILAPSANLAWWPDENHRARRCACTKYKLTTGTG